MKVDFQGHLHKPAVENTNRFVVKKNTIIGVNIYSVRHFRCEI